MLPITLISPVSMVCRLSPFFEFCATNEIGISAADDTRRIELIHRALAGGLNCIANSIAVKGYWRLLDNFEWKKCFSMTFGLIDVNRGTQSRNPTPSLTYPDSYAKQQTNINV